VKRWIVAGIAGAALTALLLVIYWPGCGWVDLYAVVSGACDAAGGGSGGAG
jgi:hypothetical protein